MPTTVSIVNNVNDLQLTTTVTGGLDPSHYTISAGAVTAETVMNYLTFDRSEGIKNGQTYVFTTTFAIGPLNFTITISLTGTVFDSNFWVQGSVGGATTGQISNDYNLHTVNGSLQNTDGSTLDYALTVQRISAIGHDDVRISVNPTHQDAASNLNLLPYSKVDFLQLLDVWGEGRIHEGTTVSGFRQAYNLNNVNQRISNGPNKGQPIPNLVPVTDYNNPKFPLPSGSALYMTMMGAPMTAGTATEMLRVLNAQVGVVFLYNLDAADIKTFEQVVAGHLIYKPNDPLGPPFNEPTFQPVRIYGWPGHNDQDEL